MTQMSTERLEALTSHILRFQPHLDKHLGRFVNPKGKRVLVVGSGWGTEIFWALAKGATYVVGLDPAPRPPEPLLACLRDTHPEADQRFQILQATTDTVADVGDFDLVISNNTFEHVFDLSKALSSTRSLLAGKGARLAIFTDPLFFSSHGSHLPIGPWEHLTERQEALKARVQPYLWSEYCRGLNGMTITTFLEAVREAGLIIESLYIVPDRALQTFPTVQKHIPPGLKPMDLCLEGIGCLLAFPEHL